MSDAFANLSTNRRLLEIKQQRLAILRESILAAERAKNEVPLNAEKHLEKILAANKLESEIINQSFAIAIDINHLKRARGDYTLESVSTF